jgi:hypothetical protein
MKKIILFTLFVAVLGLISPEAPSSQILYDDFSEDHINTQKWGQGEFVREIDGATQKLVLKYGTPNYAAYNKLTFVDPASVKSIQAAVAVVESMTEKVGDVHEIMNFFLIGAIFKRSDLTYLRAGRMRR